MNTIRTWAITSMALVIGAVAWAGESDVPPADTSPPQADQADEDAPFANRPAWAVAVGQDDHGRWADIAVGDVIQRMRWMASGIYLRGSPPEADARPGAAVASRDRDVEPSPLPPVTASLLGMLDGRPTSGEDYKRHLREKHG